MMEKNKKSNKNSKRKRKVNIVFDPKARRDFLTGFHKRKVQRREKFQADLKEMIKEEKKKINQNAKETYKNLVASHRPIPELEHLVKEEHDLGSHCVEIKELSMNELAEENNWIGTNQGTYQKEGDEADDNEDEDDEGNDQSDSELIPGMGLKSKPETKEKTKSEAKTSNTTKREFKSAKDLKRVIRKQATKQVKKSKVFKMKGKIEGVKNRKRSLRENKKQRKIFENSKKGKKLKRKKDAQGGGDDD